MSAKHRGNPYSAVRALIVKDEKILVVNGDGAGDFYCLPGGRLDFGEDLVSALVREVYEETGLTVDVGPAVFVYDFCYPKNDFHVVNVVFRCEVVAGELSDDWKDVGGPVCDRRFVSLDEMRALNVFPRTLQSGDWLRPINTSGVYQGQDRKE